MGIVGFIAMMLACACAASDGDAVGSVSIATGPRLTSSETTTTANTTTTSTTIAPPSKTEVSDTAAPVDESADSNPPTTADTDAADDPVAAITAAVEALEQSWRTCLAAVPTCDLDLLRQGRSGDLLSDLIGVAQRFSLQGFEVRQTDQIEFNVESVDIGDDGLTAMVTLCVTDSSILVEPSESGDRIVNDDFISVRYTQDFERQAQSWVALTRERVGEPGLDREAPLCSP